ncbi:MAG: hypothetical protein LQ352_003005 [Teloschistes flavicans]|nr:MAG: hypothetical protein LQ352_003005 [Teloschistes flavicans]
MESYASRNRPVRYRQPLSDTTHWVNNQSSSPSRPAPDPPRSSPPTSIPHHESLKPGGNLQTRNQPVPPIAAVINKRISAITAVVKRNENRDSQTSNSTNNTPQSRRRKTHVGPWQLGKTIGKGASGRVRKARHALTGQVAAIKIVSKVVANTQRTTSLAHMEKLVPTDKRGKRQIPFGIEREVCIMKLIEHPNVIGLYDVWENRGELYLVLEYVEGGELFNHISTHRQLPEHEAVRIFRQIIAGVSYCHRFNICHRDLKPENILLDKNFNVKIADFGLAVLQPAETPLRTSCGSPHYAAPEVIGGESYRGDRADIWSCGVVLYAMLAGYLPFDCPGDWGEVIQTVLQGHFTFPKDMSPYAQDLIFRMLQKDPNERIPIKHMWYHPFLRRYEHLDTMDANGRPYIGPLPPLTVEDCGQPMKSRDEIDEELLKNLQNLHHGLNEEELVERLLSDKPNHERILYTKLLAYVEEQLEDYPGAIIEYSTSDYHHIPKHEKPPPMPKRSSTRASLLGSRPLADRMPSRYSILVNENPRRSVSLQRPVTSSQHLPSSSADPERNPSDAKTQSSYDPYRSSRPRFNKPQADHTRITVLRNLSTRNAGERQSLTSFNRLMPAKASNQQQPVPAPSSPVDDVFSIVSSPPAANSSQLARLRHERRMSRASSKYTFASSNGTRVIRKSASYRRGVTFAHVRKRSASADISSQSLRNSSSLAPEPVEPHRASSNPLPSVPASPQSAESPTLPAPVIRSRKYVPLPREDPSRITSQIWKEDTRKVSKELENYCDEAFNRVSVASSVPTNTTVAEENRSVGTPATTYSVHDNVPMPSGAARRAAKLSDLRGYENRPLPRPPVDDKSLGSFTQRELAKTRDILIKRAADRDMPPGSLDEVIAHLDRLMQPSAVRLQEEERRAISSPDPGLAPSKDTFERFLEGRNVAFRSASEPTAESPRKRRRHGDTIRIVDDREEQKISPIKPLTIRKKSNSSTPSTETLRQQAVQDQLLQVPQFPQRGDSRSHEWAHTGERRSAGLNLLETSLEPIEEHADDRAYDEPKRSVTKKKSWFFRGHQTNKSQESDKMRPPPPSSPKKQIQQGFQNLGGRKEVPVRKRASDPASETSKSSGGKEGTSGRAKLLKFFGKAGVKTKRSGVDLTSDYDLEDDVSFVSSSTTSHQRPYLMSGALQNKSTTSFSRHRDKKNAYAQRNNNKSSVSMPTPAVAREIHPQHQNWLMKFLRIKPAVTVLPLQVSRLRARKEMVGLLREWRKYGMRDIVVDKEAGRVWARVAVNNSLHIRPVSLAIEIFTVLERGRKANLSLARFTQEKGAKSSFDRVVKTMEDVLADRGLLMEDAERGRQMAKVLG